MGPTHYCEDCTSRPVMRCGRCTCTFCARHALPPSRRCEACESDYGDELPTRRAAKVLLAPPVAIFVGGILYLVLSPLMWGNAVLAAVQAAIACGAAMGVGAGVCKLVEHNARALFMRERAGLPEARLLPQRTRS